MLNIEQDLLSYPLVPWSQSTKLIIPHRSIRILALMEYITPFATVELAQALIDSLPFASDYGNVKFTAPKRGDIVDIPLIMGPVNNAYVSDGNVPRIGYAIQPVDPEDPETEYLVKAEFQWNESIPTVNREYVGFPIETTVQFSVGSALNPSAWRLSYQLVGNSADRELFENEKFRHYGTFNSTTAGSNRPIELPTGLLNVAILPQSLYFSAWQQLRIMQKNKNLELDTNLSPIGNAVMAFSARGTISAPSDLNPALASYSPVYLENIAFGMVTLPTSYPITVLPYGAPGSDEERFYYSSRHFRVA